MTEYAEFDCDCGATTPMEFVKPTRSTPTLKPLKCQGCKSEWELRIRLAFDPRTRKRALAESKRLIRGTGKLAEVLKKKKLEALVNKPQPLAPRIYVPRGFQR